MPPQNDTLHRPRIPPGFGAGYGTLCTCDLSRVTEPQPRHGIPYRVYSETDHDACGNFGNSDGLLVAIGQYRSVASHDTQCRWALRLQTYALHDTRHNRRVCPLPGEHLDDSFDTRVQRSPQ